MAKIDRRFIKSENQLINALVVLLNKRDIDEIGINDLAKQADLNKSTFYLHFSNIQQVLGALQERIVFDIYTLYQESNWDINLFVPSLLDRVKKSKRVYRTVLLSSSLHFNESIYLTFFGNINATKGKKMNIDVYKRFNIISSVASSVYLWCLDSCSSSKEELANYIIHELSSFN